MTWSQPYLALRLARVRARRGVAWARAAVFIAVLAVCGVCAAGGIPKRFVPWKRTPAPAAKPKPAAAAQAGYIVIETGEETDLPWSNDGILRISASQNAPLLVPLPEPPPPPTITPLPPPPAPDPIGGEASGPLGIEPIVPFQSAPASPACDPGTAAIPQIGPTSTGIAIPTRPDEFGIGSRQVPFATFHLDPVAPLSQIRLRADFASGLTMPDRVERFWATSPLGPSQPERNVDFRTFSLYTEMGGEQFSAFTEVPLISMSTDMNGDTTGLGNIVVGQKFLLTNPKNRRWQIAQIMRSYLPTGSTRRGLGNGLTALEPGLLFRYRATDETYLHGEVKYWIPLGGDPQFSGQVVQYGAGLSTVLWQTDERAILSTLELVGSTIGDGQATLSSGAIERVGGTTFGSILPGLRMTLGPSGDLGLFEVGISGGVTFGDPGWYDTRALLDFRWSF